MPEEEDIEQGRYDETQGGNDPDDQREQHGEVDDALLLVAVINHGLDVDKELLEIGTILRRVVSPRYQLGLHDGI